MARKPRIHYPGAHYRVMLSGNGGMDIFADDQERYRFFLLLKEGVERFGYRVFVYCLMDNHIAVQVGEVTLPSTNSDGRPQNPFYPSSW